MSNPFPRSRPGSKTVCLDIDNTIGRYTDALRPYAAECLGVDPASLADPMLCDYDEWGLNKQQFAAVHAAAVEDGMFARMEVMPGAADALRALSDDGYHLLIVTSRLLVRRQHAKVVGDTIAFLENNNLPFWDLCMLTDKQHLRADVFIDDSPSQIEALRAAGQQVIVFDQNYNQHFDGPRLTRWDDAPVVIGAVLAGQSACTVAA